MLDAIVVGGGPAGLSAALCLGRARRTTLLIDAGEGRNAPATNVHNLFAHDGTPPAELRRLGRAELGHYPHRPRCRRAGHRHLGRARRRVPGRFR